MANNKEIQELEIQVEVVGAKEGIKELDRYAGRYRKIQQEAERASKAVKKVNRESKPIPKTNQPYVQKNRKPDWYYNSPRSRRFSFTKNINNNQPQNAWFNKPGALKTKQWRNTVTEANSIFHSGAETPLMKRVREKLEKEELKVSNARIARAKKAFKIAPTHGNKSMTPDLSSAMKLRAEEIENQLKTFKLAPTHGGKSLTPKLSSAMQSRVDEVSKQLKSFKLAPTHGKKMLSPEISPNMELANLMADGREKAQADRKKADLKAQQLASEKKIADKKAEEAKWAEEGARIESNYVKAKRRMSAYKQSGYSSRSKVENNAIKAHNARVEEMNKGAIKVGKGLDKVRTGVEGLGNSAMMAVGQITMLGGALFMFVMMGSMVAQKAIAIGDMFAEVEKDFLAGAGFRESVFRKRGEQGRKDFDDIVSNERRISGRTREASSAFLGRGANALENAGGIVNKSSLQSLVTASHGASFLTGKDSDASMQSILELARSGDGKKASKLGLEELKLTKNMNENLDIIAKAVERDPIASTMLKRGTVGGAMERIKSAPKALAGKVMENYGPIIQETFQGLSDRVLGAFTSPETVELFTRVFENFRITAEQVFSPERLQKMMNGLAQWSAEMINIGGHIINGVGWVLENPQKVLDAFKWAGRIIVAVAGLKAIKGVADIVGGTISMISGAHDVYRAFMGLEVVTASGNAMKIASGLQGLFGLIGGIFTSMKVFLLANPWLMAIAGVGALAYFGINYANKKKEEMKRDNPEKWAEYERNQNKKAPWRKFFENIGILQKTDEKLAMPTIPENGEYLKLGSKALGNSIDPVDAFKTGNFYDNPNGTYLGNEKQRLGFLNNSTIYVVNNANISSDLGAKEASYLESSWDY